jgi:DNA-binding transcriptional LysR family regulator
MAHDMLKSLETIDSRWLRAFVAVADSGSFTTAARQVAMTQSGISQHVARLEEALEVPLFTRSRDGAALTEAGRRFYDFVGRYASSVAALRRELTGAVETLAGPVTYAMPESCLFADHFEKVLAKRAKEFPDITLSVLIRPMDQVYDAVRSGDADFGFVAGERRDPVFRHELFCREEYVLVLPRGKGRDLKAKDVTSLRFVDYPGFHENFALWFQMHFGKARTPQTHNLDIAGRVGSLFGVMTMVRAGVGVTVAPRQCARPLFETYGFETFPKRSEDAHQHDIHIVSRRDRGGSARVRRVIDAFLAMHA